MKLHSNHFRRKIIVVSFAALWVVATLPMSVPGATNTEVDVSLTASPGVLATGTTSASDVTFVNFPYASTTFDLPGTTYAAGSIDDLNTLQTFTIEPGITTGPATINLGGGTDGVTGSATGDLVFVTAGGNLTLGTNATLALGAAGNFDEGFMGVLNIAGPITGNFGFTKSGAGLLALTGANTFVGTTSVTALTASNTSVLNINSNAALGAAGNGLAFTGTGTATLQLAAGAGAVTLAGRATTIGTSVTAIFDRTGRPTA